MKVYVLFFIIMFSSCKNEQEIKKDIKVENQKELIVYDFNELEPLLNIQDDKTYVVNFWATWCAPCVKELPYFETLNKEYKSKDVEVLLVSLDFPNQYDKRLKPFIAKHELRSKVVALNDVDSNSWIPKISEEWTGAIPATIIYNKSKRQFYEQSFNYSELKTEVDKFLN
ncbi:TlpA disulfide reductase family protein [uncultured Lacinutrix sp.]|uniref:TlpA disulfide reductase family protein n=1 Tax=uncultured Lacinutrix sp. TaxID=574032 RepID=UPI002616BFAB|nr:TlpA disulfide reductase family protein [uncultured Lacinutrix sp.]